jgi:hypothetical protein
VPKRRDSDWLVQVYGEQRDDIELDLLAQIVIMLGWQLQRETLTDQHGLDKTSPHH